MRVTETKIKDVKIIEPVVFTDDRGFFMESYREDWFRENVANVTFVQDNHSKSSRGILRGLHYQRKQAQGKLVRVIKGEIFDVVVDLRKGSLTYGKWLGFKISAENKNQLWVPEGFAHGFLVTSDIAEVCYRCTNYYDPESEVSIAYDEPSLSIEWPELGDTPIFLSDKDKNGCSLSNAPHFIS
ncbi:dTDP-4-dehydrorhamnose 3,5-epimerase [Aliiglaciecola sp. M165]|uniref:dTDP-4-dehydrorhamnose 3,5-epimerase n=1 Tax=Aliiglaciecola sp. M165 TaxID=2593649 RepID=UPI00117DF17E|nr:dTDP-4-dehydrorhamnose 3,5-epimerase [Aliiglaciecola sp. M165]TRY30767.1 dTDP-4-dehydrorhamnose 3,5-epimerase [Aliiglaciecola sp. M165]